MYLQQKFQNIKFPKNMFQYKKNMPNKKQIDSNTLLLGLYLQID